MSETPWPDDDPSHGRAPSDPDTSDLAGPGESRPRDHDGRSRIDRAWTYYRRNGLRSLVRRISDEVRYRGAVNHRSGAKVKIPWVDKNPHNIFANIDTPARGFIVSTADLILNGWACARTGIASVEIFLDSTPAVHLMTGGERNDVARMHATVPGAAVSGFSTSLRVDSLDPGEHTLSVVVRDHAGSTRVLVLPFSLVATGVMYHRYYLRMLPSASEMATARGRAAERDSHTDIRVVVDANDARDVGQTLRSIAAQEYPSWRCTVVTGTADLAAAEMTIHDMSGTVATRFELTTSPWELGSDPIDASRYYTFLQAGETMSPHALACYVYDQMDTAPADIIYSDHDTIQRTGRHSDPWFDPDWSPDYLLSRDYVGGVYLVRDSQEFRDALHKVRPFTDPAWRYDLLLTLTDGDAVVGHIPRVLWSAPPRQQAEQDVLWAAETRAVSAALERRTTGATVAATAGSGIRSVVWPVTGQPLVSIIIPTTGRMDLLRPCVTSLVATTSYDRYEFLFLDNGRGAHPDGIAWLRSLGHRVIERNEPFNWARLNNVGARAASGELLLFLNDDIEITNAGWLTAMTRLAVRPDIGTVGSLLTYPDGSIQHAGVVLVGHGGGAMHILHRMDPAGEVYLDLDKVTRETTANTGACLMVSREHFEQVGGFDEQLEIVGNDIDLCLRLNALGYRSVWTPDSALVHHESLSRKAVSIIADETRMWRRWSEVLRTGDPYFSPHLTQDRPDCTIDWSRMLRRPEPAVDPTTGVNLIGYIRAEMGVGEAARGQAQAMTEAAVPFLTIDYGGGNPARMHDDTFAHTVAIKPAYDVNLIYINAAELGDALTELPQDLRTNRYTIGQWAWEMPEFPDRWSHAFGLVDEVWCPSEFVRSSVAAKAPVPVVCVPHAVRVPHGPFLDRRHFGLPDTPYQFLMMYDVNSVQERKNPRGALEAFTKAFGPDDRSVMLVIKINNADRFERRQIGDMIDGRPNVAVVDEVLDRDEVGSLMSCSDAFVSLHRSEGFGLTIAEAMGLGKPVIATYWSGNVDFMTEGNAACVRYSLVRLGKDHGPYSADQQWADPDLDHAAWWMRRLRDDRGFGEALGRLGQETILRDFDPLQIGMLTAQRLEEIRSSTGGVAVR